MTAKLMTLFSSAVIAAVQAAASGTAAMSADFTKETGPLRRELHSSGFAPRSTANWGITEQVKELNFDYVRTHDLALVNAGQRVVDTHFIFPLMHLDAKDPKNYVFAPTDHLLGLSRDAGLKIFYRLGTSIEHTGKKVHFNSLIPDDFDKTAEVYAGIIRHYNKGWADGFNWNIRYWEIWNEPDGRNNMWCLPGGDASFADTHERRVAENAVLNAKRRALFVKFFVTCLKRLKSEFPDIKVGGPALCRYRPDYFADILKACKEAGVAPDFISWHYYGDDPSLVINWAVEARRQCDSFGFRDCELIINEWHYRGPYGWKGMRSDDPEDIRQVWEVPSSQNGIDSSCFSLSLMSMFQTSEYAQAYFYGCRHTGAYGYMDGCRRKYKIWHAFKTFGKIVRDSSVLCASAGDGTVTVLAAKSADGKSGDLLVSDYRGTGDVLVLDVKGVRGVVSATLLDHERDNVKADVVFDGGKLTLKKKMPGSAAFHVKFDL